MVTVYLFKGYNIIAGESKIPPMRGTREAIDAIRGEVIEESVEQIDAAFVRDTETE